MRLVRAGRHAERDQKPVPGIDRSDSEGEVDEFVGSEVRLDALVDVVRDVSLGNQGDCFGPLERSALTVGIEGGFSPGIEEIETLLGLAEGARVFGVHIEAVGTAIDLGSAHFDELEQGVLEAAGIDVVLHCQDGLITLGRDLRKIHS